MILLKRFNIKGSAFLLLVSLAVTIAGLGIFFDGNVIPNPTSSEDLIQETAAKSFSDLSANQTITSDQPSEVAQQLKRAIDAANQIDTDEIEALSDKQTASNETITETNQLLEEKGVIRAMDSESEKSREFNQKIEELKARLVKLQQSN